MNIELPVMHAHIFRRQRILESATFDQTSTFIQKLQTDFGVLSDVLYFEITSVRVLRRPEFRD